VLNHGGFLGIGAEEVALPAERFVVQGDRLLLSGVTEQEVDMLAQQSEQMTQYLRAESNAQISLIVQQ
jgi:hypothetical protein